MITSVGLALLGGLLLVVGHPPIGFGWAGFVAIAPLVALGRNLSAGPVRRALPYGLLAGVITYGLLLYWLIPFGFLAFGLLSVVQALYTAAFVALVALFGEMPGRGVWTAASWVALEVVRGSWPLGGFSWGVVAYTQADGGLALGAARTVGTVGVSLLLAAVAVAVEAAIRGALRSWEGARETDVPADAVFGAIRTPLLTILAVLAISVLVAAEPPGPTDETLAIGVVQGGDTRATSAAGVNRIDTDRIIRVTELMEERTRELEDEDLDVVIWPENSLDSDVRTERGETVAGLLRDALDRVAPTPILGGETARGPRDGTLWNRMTVFRAAASDDGAVGAEVEIGDSYNKRRPVPFAEYIPGRSYLDWIPPLEQIPNDVLQGEGPQTIELAGATIGPVICFENTFPALARDQVDAGADVLVVSTNNSSFGVTPMSAQHVAFSQVRAVETGRWVVHAGISGISGFISPEGEILQETGLFEPAAIQRDVPLIREVTIATRLGPWPARLVLLTSLVGLILAVRERGYFFFA
ncbi:apolipoprotein N-acyltransferase [Euzebya tangerina]|uniref:apolipoprotein N-acyltransferase n=1 Tax=Euzebya tangerina TaxID=591198 RepID=UPI000E310BE6|nr:apolipoprotein N-acyltransferase [Euzebya tangerina]